jgi:hypothetical protein
MKLKRKTKDGAPPIFADLVIEMSDGTCYRVDVEHPGWMSDVRPALKKCKRSGLVSRKDNIIRVWLTPDGEPEYLSRVIGKVMMEGSGHDCMRVAGLRCDGVSVWLHQDGLVEVAPEPTWRS